MGPDRAHRLWRQAGLQVPRRRVAASRPRPLPPTEQPGQSGAVKAFQTASGLARVDGIAGRETIVTPDALLAALRW